MSEYFTQVKLNLGQKVDVVDVKGKHLFKAMKDAGTESGTYLKHLMANTLFIDGQPVTIEWLEDLPANELLSLLDAINIQLEPPKQYKL